MALSTDLSFMDLGLLLDKEDNLLNFEKDLISDDIKFNLDSKSNHNDDWTNGVDFLDSLLEMETCNQPYDLLHDDKLLENDILSTTAESVVESSSCSDSGVSSDQQLSPMVPDMEDEEEEEVIIEEEVYTEPESEIKEEVVEIEDAAHQDDIRQMDSVDVKQENKPALATLSVSKISPGVPPTVRVKPVPAVVAPHRVIRVTPLQATNPRSILIPVNGVSGVRTIKIINAGAKSQASVSARARQMLNNSAVITTIDDKYSASETNEEQGSVYPRLLLSAEEKRLMSKEGITLPSHYPLTKHEERELKRIRRKIRNKISAQDSRKRKKEYVDGLEDRVKQCTEENLTLLKRLKVLQSQNQSLSAQLRRLQAAVVRGSTQSTQPATCLMVLVLSLALVMAPNLRPANSRAATHQDLQIPESKSTPLAGRSRTLLFTKPPDHTHMESTFNQNNAGDEEEQDSKKIMADLEDLLHFNKPQQDDHDYSQAYTVGRKRTKTYIVPDIDDTWPPPKIPRTDSGHIKQIELHNKTRKTSGNRNFIMELPE